MSQFSVRSVLSHSWEAGGIYPTLLGYVLGALATFSICGANHWILRFVPAAFAFLVFFTTITTMENNSFAFLVVFSSIIGIGCTYIQVLSWQQAFATVETNRTQANRHKTDKED